MKPITVQLAERSYPIVVANSFRGLSGQLKQLGLPRRAIVITHPQLLARSTGQVPGILRKAGFTVDVLTVPASETSKSFAVVQKLIAAIAQKSAMNTPWLAALGGGVVGDITGFVAAIFRRGVPYVQIPTTLLAQVDSAIGGKTGIDVAQAKNQVGAFYQPKLVWNNSAVLVSLPLQQRRSGLAEIIKYGIIADPVLFGILERRMPQCLSLQPSVVEELTARSCCIKARVVSQDEREKQDIRVQLNFGHSLGHALEAASGYIRLTHGEAIAIGMCAAASMATAAGFCPQALSARIHAVIAKAGLPTHARGISLKRVREALRHDKKFIRGRARWVLPTRLGRVVVTEAVPGRIVEDVLARYVLAR